MKVRSHCQFWFTLFLPLKRLVKCGRAWETLSYAVKYMWCVLDFMLCLLNFSFTIFTLLIWECKHSMAGKNYRTGFLPPDRVGQSATFFIWSSSRCSVRSSADLWKCCGIILPPQLMTAAHARSNWISLKTFIPPNGHPANRSQARKQRVTYTTGRRRRAFSDSKNRQIGKGFLD